MSDWSDGYVTDISYTYGYYPELNPLRVPWAFIDEGIVAPEVTAACELGFGQGMSVNIHAAASPVQWWATDFNPSQAAFAQSLATVSGAPARLLDEAFADFTHRTDLPDFDFVGIHGIWSWISAENRAHMVDFLRRKLKVGGVLYISYNTQPGWAATVPFRDLLMDYTEVMAAPGPGVVGQVNGALQFAEQLLAVHPQFAKANPTIPDRLKKIKDQNGHYLAHEYFNRDWHPMSFADMHRALAPAKLNFACSAHLLDHIDAINLSTEQQTFLNTLPVGPFRNTVRDFLVNQQFRRDYWVKGRRALDPIERTEQWRAQRVMLVVPRQGLEWKATGTLGEATLTETVYAPIADLLADHKPRTVGQIEQSLKETGLNFGQLTQALTVLIGKGTLAPAQEEKVAAKSRATVDKLNLHLMQKARGSGDIAFLANPMTGGGMSCSRFQQLFLLAKQQGKKSADEWAQFVWQCLTAQGQRIIKEGKTLDTEQENMTELRQQAKTFADEQLPLLKAWGLSH